MIFPTIIAPIIPPLSGFRKKPEIKINEALGEAYRKNPSYTDPSYILATSWLRNENQIACASQYIGK